MSSELALTVRDVAKSYRITHADRHSTIREALMARLRRRARRPPVETFWALDGVSFDVRRGEVLGIVGRNGAGKSTLLKVLSRITPPTRGEVRLAGTVGSLLEVGTGFHGELTGRENIFLNGAILGMRRREIERQFDAIVDFADVERFLDTPVKRYSSGMYVRLAFAVAAHLDPDILIVDEVLAVGDAAFQSKCLGRMRQVARDEGRTVLFVSHNMAAVNSLCTRGLFVEQGRIVVDGTVEQVVGHYQARVHAAAGEAIDLRAAPRRSDGRARLTAVRVTPVDGAGAELPGGATGCGWEVAVELESDADVPNAELDLILYDMNGYRLADVNTAKKGIALHLRRGHEARVVFTIRDALLKPGTYAVGLWLGTTAQTVDHVDPATTLSVLTYSEGQRHEQYPGPYTPRFECSVSQRPVAVGDPMEEMVP